ncbi:synaptophysin-like protein 2 isoform X3 [Zootermopsis nevadensis]|uniref:synaptophysin-like protein 2 isoform X3 n=1 Tax=Zootermopsis nevadensis TaxID=136037 RepID=UPI000B8E3B20|nr:synaptophysin-like protein 2 isoform X3 [Zootermopsis nevadensis]
MDSSQPMPTQYETGMPPARDPNVGSPYKALRSSMSMNLGVFREPRGVMRILQFIFSICAFATTTGFSSYVEITLNCEDKAFKLEYSYPFRLDHVQRTVDFCNKTESFHLIGDFSSDAQFFVATGVLSFLYCIGIIFVYVMFDAMYQSNGLLPLADFFLTVTLAVFWLSGSAAWANGLNGLKGTTHNIINTKQCHEVCKSLSFASVSELTISVILGFLNFFLWASDLWFLYKETPWFKLKQSTDVNSAA